MAGMAGITIIPLITILGTLTIPTQDTRSISSIDRR